MTEQTKHQKRELKKQQKEEEKANLEQKRKSSSRKKTVKRVSYGAIVFLIIVFGFLIFPKGSDEPSEMDLFAQCLTENGAVMYGTETCPYCQKQKSYFGSAFKHINYVDCKKQQLLCREKGVSGVPAWSFNDGELHSGLRPLENLAELAGCELP